MTMNDVPEVKRVSSSMAGDVMEVATAALKAQLIGESEVPVLLVPKGYEAHVLAGMTENPLRVVKEVKLDSLESFLRYVKAQGGDDGRTVVFAHAPLRVFTAVFDYHVGAEPGWCVARARYMCEVSRALTVWHEKLGKRLSQMDFVEWIEDHQEDVAEAAPLLTVARALEGIVETRFAMAGNLQTGDRRLVWETETKVKEEMRVPEEFDLGIPVFEHGEPYRIPVRLRFRIRDGEVYFIMRAPGLEDAIDDGWQGFMETASAELGFPLYAGSAPAPSAMRWKVE